MGLGRMALAFLLHNGGATYLAEQMVSEALQSGRLYQVEDAPVIDRHVYAVYLLSSDRKTLLEQVLMFFNSAKTADGSIPTAAAMPVL